MLLTISSYTDFECGYYQFYDSRSNTESFLQYFMRREGSLCVNCSKYSANFVFPCNNICYYEPEIFSYSRLVLYESNFVTYDEFSNLYFVPIILLQFYFFVLFFVLLRYIYCHVFDILILLPSPTKNIECKFQTLLHSLQSSGINIFRSYKYKTAFYYFSSVVGKSLVFFIYISLSFGIIPIEALHKYPKEIMPYAFSFCSFLLSMSYLFTSPFISILHNIVNFVSYLVLSIFLFVIGFHLSHIIEIPTSVGNFLFIIIIITPVITALITPFFAKKDPLLVPTHFELITINKWDKKLKKLLKYRNDYNNAMRTRKNKKNIKNQNDNNDEFDENEVFYQDEPSISVSYFEDNHHKEEDINILGQFSLIKLAPIKIQEQIDHYSEKNEYKIYKRELDEIWYRTDIEEDIFQKARNELFFLSNKLIDCISYNKLYNLLTLSIIITSMCLGWILSVGIYHWKKQILGPNWGKYYVRCNMFPNGTYPNYGTY